MAADQVRTLEDMAVMCGVSASTVSRVLNNEPGISKETRERVLLAAEQHGFTLQKRKKQAGRAHIHLAVVIPDPSETVNNPFYEMADILNAINSVFARGRKNVQVLTFSDLRDTIEDSSFSVDGMILAFGSPGQIVRARLRELGVPCVFLNRTFDGENCVSCNHVKGMLQLYRHLAGTGHCNIGYLGFRGHPVNSDRVLGYVSGTAEARGTYSDDAVLMVDAIEDVDTGTAGFFVEKGCDAVMCFNDNFAVRLINELSGIGVSVPGSMSVSGFDNSPVRKIFRPAITTINLSTFEMVFLAARWLKDNIVNKRNRILHCEVEGALVEGDTVKKRGQDGRG